MNLTTNDILNIIAWAAVAVGVLVSAAYLWHYLRYRSGRLAHGKVMGALKRYGVIRNYRVLENVRLRFGKAETTIECMMVGFFGILLVCPVNDNAGYYGDAAAKEWVKVAGEKRSRMENLCAKNQRDIALLRDILRAQDVYGTQMEGLVVFCGNVKKTDYGINGAQGLMNFKQFKAYLQKPKFEKDNDVDVPGLAGMILKHRV